MGYKGLYGIDYRSNYRGSFVAGPSEDYLTPSRFTVDRDTVTWINRNGVYVQAPVDSLLISSFRDNIPIFEAKTNVCVYSTDIHQFGQIGATSVQNDRAAPNGETEAAAIYANATGGQHYKQRLFLVALSAGIGTVTFRARPNATDGRYVALGNWTNGGGEAVVIFDTENGDVELVETDPGDYHSARIEALADAWVECHVSRNHAAGVTPGVKIFAAKDGTPVSTSFTGDGSTKLFHAWGANMVEGYERPHIETAAAAATCNASDVDLSGGPVGAGYFGCKVKFSNVDILNERTIFSFSDGGAVADSVEAVVASSGDQVTLRTRKTAGNNGDVTIATDVADGEWHDVMCRWDDNNLFLSVDGDSDTDTSCDIATAMDTWKLGRNYNNASYLNGEVSYCQMGG